VSQVKNYENGETYFVLPWNYEFHICLMSCLLVNYMIHYM